MIGACAPFGVREKSSDGAYMWHGRIASLLALPRGFIGSIALAGTTLGCGDSSSSDGPTIPDEQVRVAPALESVPFQLLGVGKIAFERIVNDGGPSATYVVDATAARSTSTFVNQLVMGVSLSPDGQRFAYVARPDGSNRFDVYVSKSDGTGAQHVTSFATNAGSPTWTPDGARIVEASGTDLVWDVYSQSPVADAGDRTQLTHFTVTPGTALTCPVLSLGDVGRVGISFEGRIVFACLFAEIDVSTNGTFSTAYQPSRVDRRNWPNVFAPSWSPDGARIAFIETTSDSATNYSLISLALKVMDADGSGVTTLASIPMSAGSDASAGGSWAGYNNISLCWMPDGSRLVFNVPESLLVGHLWVVRADGSELAQFTTSPGVWDRGVSCSR
jgi:dipeptidyl aminopeptidase/acylaminoacyl peptidase